MNQKPLPYPPQMRNGGLPPAHLPFSPHSDPVVAIANLKAIVSDAIAASAEKSACRQQLLDEQAARARQEAAVARTRVSNAIAHACQEAAAACTRQEATRRQQLLDEQAACARQEAAATRAHQEAARRQ